MSFSVVPPWVPAIFLLATSAATSTATETDADALMERFHRLRASAVAPELERYRDALATLERSLADARDYAGALHVQRERLRVEAQLVRLPPPTPDDALTAAGTNQGDGADRPGEGTAADDSHTIVLGAADVAESEGVEYDAAAGSLRGWASGGAFAQWPLPDGLPLGGYEVEIIYQNPGEEPAPVQIRGPFYFIARRLPPTGGTEQTRALGTLRLQAGARSLRIVAAEDAPPTLAIRELRLRNADRR